MGNHNAVPPSPAIATLGIDASSLITDFSYLSAENYEFAIFRGSRSNGTLDSHVVENIRNARSGGMSSVDVYLFPCVTCDDPSTQVDALVDAIRGESYGKIWLDVERNQWSSSLDSNRNFIVKAIRALRGRGQTVGIYTNYYNWQEIVGLNWDEAKEYPLWYAHYDGIANFSDFKPFGGWTSPFMKQYKENVLINGIKVDLNYTES